MKNAYIFIGSIVVIVIGTLAFAWHAGNTGDVTDMNTIGTTSAPHETINSGSDVQSVPVVSSTTTSVTIASTTATSTKSVATSSVVVKP